VAFRVICDSVASCYAILGLVHSRWVPVPGQIKDYIAMPKPNRYQSLHTTVSGDDGQRMEIQIRTKQMHETAEYGIAAHWSYKESKQFSASTNDVYMWLREILDNQQGVDDSREFLDSVKVDLFHEEVYVFTPEGDIKTLAAGATPLDFAYSVHSEVGSHCHGARVNGVQVPFDTRLKNGDKVEIITSGEQRPTKAWLDIAKTSRARNKINAYLRAEQKKHSLSIGKDLLEKALRKEGFSYSKVLKSGKLDAIAPKYKMSSATEIIAAVGYGKLDENRVVLEQIPEDLRDAATDNLRESPFEKLLRKVKWQDDGIIIDGVDDLLVNFAGCCNPLPGEAVIGYVSRGRGIIVHKQKCIQAANLEKERRIKVQWADNAVSKRPVHLQIVTGDKSGILASLSNCFHDRNINIASVKSESGDNDEAVTTFVFPIKNVAELNGLIKALKQIKGVYRVTRITG
jgi:GTP pyrophosphokinase